ncbi:hypothetical protein C6495_07760, partial [Candidatus Poribacteria bacterium]
MVNDEQERVILNVLTDVRTRMHRQVLLQKVTSTVFCGLLLLAVLFVVNRFVLLPLPGRMVGIAMLVVLG